MEEDNEEFEPLFDYTRIQPKDVICLDDDSPEASPICLSKKQKVSGAEVVKKVNGVSVINCDDQEDAEEDWLPPPPPPKNFNHSNKMLQNDSTLKALRLKKQELASFAQTADELVRSVEESVRKELCASLQESPPQSSADHPSEPAPERAKLVISIQDKDGVKQFRVFKDDKLEQLFKMYADRVKLDMKVLVFTFDGDKIRSTSTPDSLGMDDDDIIEVQVKTS